MIDKKLEKMRRAVALKIISEKFEITKKSPSDEKSRK
jgi:hypothetical protein